MATMVRVHKLWRKLCKELPEESEETCFKFAKLELGVGIAASNAPQAGGGVTSGDQGGGPPQQPGKKRKQEKSGGNRARKKVKARVASNEEAKSIIVSMHALGQRMMNAFLPDMTTGLPSKKAEWKKYRENHGGDFQMGGFLMLLARSKGMATLYNDSVRKDLLARDSAVATDFYEVFPTFAVLEYRMKNMGMDWPKWWS